LGGISRGKYLIYCNLRNRGSEGFLRMAKRKEDSSAGVLTERNVPRPTLGKRELVSGGQLPLKKRKIF